MELRATRYDLAPRNMEIPHPVAFSKLVRELKTSWSNWEAVMSNPSSGLRLTDHCDGRVFSMVSHIEAESLIRPESRFRAKVDIANFYGSVYSHAIPWAVHGIENAKANRNVGNDWANRLDTVVRQSRRGETVGLSVGPGTSAIIGELLLYSVDEKLCELNYKFIRFIDDYYFFGENRNETEAFIHSLRELLEPLKLTINPIKTHITELPLPLRPRWKRELVQLIRGETTPGKLLDLLDQAIESHQKTDEEGALRFALVALESILQREQDYLQEEHLSVITDRLLDIGFLRPVAIGSACRTWTSTRRGMSIDQSQRFNRILREHAKNRRTDAATWLLHTLLLHSFPLDKSTLEQIVDSRDTMSMALLTANDKYISYVVDFLENFERRQPPNYMRDEYWLLYYQLALKGQKIAAVPEEYYDDFQPLLDAEVSFVDLTAENPYQPFHSVGPEDSGPQAGWGFSGGGGGPYIH